MNTNNMQMNTPVTVKNFLKVWDKIARLEALSDRQLCLKLGISPGTASSWRTGKAKVIRMRELRLIRQKLAYEVGINADGSLSIKSRKGSVEQEKNERFEFPAKPEERETISRLQFPYAKGLGLVNGRFEYKGAAMTTPFPTKEIDSAVWIRMEDDSMEPIIHTHDLLLVSPDRQSKAEGIALVFTEGFPNGIVREIKWLDETIYHLIPFNQRTKPNELTGLDERVFPLVFLRVNQAVAAFPILCVAYSHSRSEFTPH